MSRDQLQESKSAEQLSALLDGEVDAAGVSRACAHWRDDAASRDVWHAYHLIGDVMRSEDLASTAARDAAFLARLRVRLSSEPVVLAPAPLVAPIAVPARGGARLVRRWRGPAAVAAGFVAVAGVLVVTRTSQQETAQIAVAPASVAPVVVPVVTETAADPQAVVATGRFIRDARIDRYLAAHQQFAGSSALGMPSAFLRSATADASNR